MSDQFIGEIRMFAGSFAPLGWALCNGQSLSIFQNTALFSLLGTTFGGNGTSTFALPNLQAAAPLQAGQGLGLSSKELGQSGGSQTVTLGAAQMPAHTHQAQATPGEADEASPANASWAATHQRGGVLYSDPTAATRPMSSGALAPAGGNQPHNNMPPYLGLTFIIALDGVFPLRS